MQTSSRRGIQFPSLDRSDRPDVPAHIKNLIDALELDAPTTMGSAAARPANPGYPRWFYWAQDTKVLSFWDGAAWTDVGSTDLIKQTLIDAKGDLIVGVNDNTAGRLPVGPNGYAVIADNTQPQGMAWKLNAVLDLMAGKGDLPVGLGTDSMGRLAPGADGQALIADAAQTLGLKWASPVLAFAQAQLSADVALTNGTAWFDGPSLSLVAGTWKIDAVLTCLRPGSSDTMLGRLYDGTNSLASTQSGANNTPDGLTLPLTAIVTLASTTTIRAQAKNTSPSTTGTIKAALPVDSVGNNASIITAIKIA